LREAGLRRTGNARGGRQGERVFGEHGGRDAIKPEIQNISKAASQRFCSGAVPAPTLGCARALETCKHNKNI
jgi:hypothetical protein